jgi:hypothetical protein
MIVRVSSVHEIPAAEKESGETTTSGTAQGRRQLLAVTDGGV